MRNQTAKEEIQQKLKGISASIYFNKANFLPTSKLQSEFYKLSKEYKKIWLKEQKGGL